MIKEHWWNDTNEGKTNCHFFHHNSLTIWNRNRTSDMKDRRLTAYTMARPEKAIKSAPGTANYCAEQWIIELNLDIKYLFFLAVGCVCVSRFRALSERGLMKRQMHIWHPAPPKCYGNSEVQGVQLKAISLALILLAAGIIMSLVMLVIELFSAQKPSNAK